MKRKGYVFSLAVFVIFISVLLIATTSMKSLSVTAKSSYEQISTIKAANMAKNIEDILSAKTPMSSVNCTNVSAALNSIANELPFYIEISCSVNPSPIVSVNSLSCTYIYGQRILGKC